MISRVLYAGFLASALSVSALPTLAQTAPDSSATTTAEVAVAPASDSVKAVKRLFASRRTGGTLLGLPGGYMFGYGLVTTIRNEVSGGPVTLAVGTALSAVSISKGMRFSRDKEEEILTDYKQGKPLPKAIRRRLHKKHFRK